MKNITKIVVLAIGLAGFLTSCSKEYLQQTDPNNIAEQNFYKTEQEALFGLYGIYDAYQATELFGLNITLFDGLTDNATNTQSTSGFLYIESSNHGPTVKPVTDLYSNLYNVVNRANYVIKRTSEIAGGNISEPSRKRIIAEGSFLRDFAYFMLVNLYRDVPFYTEPQTAFSTGKPPTKKADIYSFLKQDLLKIIPDLPVTIPAAESGRTGKGGAMALLGKIYLYDKDYTNAASTLAQLMAAPFAYTLYPDYATLFSPLPAAEFSSENLFQINFVSNGVDNGSFFAETIDNTAQARTPRVNYVPIANLVDSYLCSDGKPIANSTLYGSKSPLYNATGINRFLNRDPRLRASIFTSADVLPNGAKVWAFTSNNSFAIKKYIQITTTQYPANPQNFYVIRYADVLLMYAEAKNELAAPDASVYTAVNLVRRRVSMPDYPVGLTQDQMRQMIRDERRWEFALEYERYFDLKRWEVIDDIIASIGPTGVTVKKFTNPRDYVWPIPQGEVDNSPAVSQAPEWK